MNFNNHYLNDSNEKSGSQMSLLMHDNVSNGTIINKNINNSIQGTTNNGQKLIRLVEKIWNQITIHQKKSSSSTMINNNDNHSHKKIDNSIKNQQNYHLNNSSHDVRRINNRGGAMLIMNGSSNQNDNINRKIVHGIKMHNVVKTKYQDRNNYDHHQKRLLTRISLSSCNTVNVKSKKTMPSSSKTKIIKMDNQDSDDSIQCDKCEYHFVDGRIVNKTKCTHGKSSSHLVNDDMLIGQIKSKSLFNSVNNIKTNQHHGSSWINKSNTHPNNRQAMVNPNYTTTSRIVTTKPDQDAVNGHGQQCIIQTNNSHSIKKYIEAEIIFDNKNMVGVIPIVEPNDDVDDRNISIADTIVDTKQSPKITESEKSEKIEEATENRSSFLGNDNDVDKDESGKGFIENEHQLTSKLSASENSQKEMMEETNHGVDDDDDETVIINTSFINLNSNSDGNSLMEQKQRCLKKIKCLITTFITIQTEKDLNNGMVEVDEIGFDNFDGNNIGLYKNIGYINRNEKKFAKPSKDLLKLLLNDFNCDSQNNKIDKEKNLTDNKEQSQNENQPQQDYELLDLSQFYNDLDENERCYSKKFFFQVLDSLCRQDDSLKNQIRAKRNFYYPDSEYSSDGEDQKSSSATSITRTTGTNPYSLTNEQKHHQMDNLCALPPLFDGQVNIRIATCFNKDELNDKLFGALFRSNNNNYTNQRKFSNKTVSIDRNLNDIESDYCQKANNDKGQNENNETFKRNVQSSLQQKLLKLNSYFITEVSFNRSN